MSKTAIKAALAAVAVAAYLVVVPQFLARLAYSADDINDVW
jgi:hypothetical protein